MGGWGVYSLTTIIVIAPDTIVDHKWGQDKIDSRNVRIYLLNESSPRVVSMVAGGWLAKWGKIVDGDETDSR